MSAKTQGVIIVLTFLGVVGLYIIGGYLYSQYKQAINNPGKTLLSALNL